MSYLKRIAGFAVVFGLTMASIARADDGLRLSTVAAENGYSYADMMTEAGATLTRPGVRIVIRAGRLFYEVNAATPVADVAPRYAGGDIIVSRKLADSLRALALKYPYPRAAQLDIDPPAGTGNFYTIAVHQVPGHETLAVTGNGPANSPVLFTVMAQLSSDLPETTLSRYIVMTDAQGNFATQAPYGQDAHAGTFLLLRAGAPDGTGTASATFTINVPSAHIKKSALDEWPKK